MKTLFISVLLLIGAGRVSAQNYTYAVINGITEVAGTGTPVTLTSSASSGVLPIGFSFSFYGNTYTDFYINPTGTITFSGANQTYLVPGNNVIVSANAPNHFIGFAFGGLSPQYMAPSIYPDFTNANINYFVSGTAPNRKLVVNYKGVILPAEFLLPEAQLDIQIQLYEGSEGKIEIHNTHNAAFWNPSYNFGRFIQVGIENAAGTNGIAVTGQTDWNLDNKTVRLNYVPAGPIILADINPVCATGSTTNTSTTLSVTGCSTNVTWSSVPANAPKPSGNSGTIYGSSLTQNVSYTAYCPTNGLTSAAYVLNYIQSNGTITANPAAVTVPGTPVALSFSGSAGTFDWFANTNISLGYGGESPVGSGSSISHSPTTTTEYRVKTTNSGCIFYTPSTRVRYQLTLSGTGDGNIDKTMNEGCERYLVADGGSGTPAIACPNNSPDADTYYYNGGLTTFTCGFFGTCWRGYFVMRKNNVWEIWKLEGGFNNPNTSQRLYYTNETSTLSRPPCSASWTKEADASTVIIAMTGVCSSVAGPCPQNLTLSSTNVPSDDVNTGTLLKEASAANGTITATNKITGTANVTYQAKSIQLNEGFKADNGTVFLAQTGGCN